MDYVKIPTRFPDYKSEKEIREKIGDYVKLVSTTDSCAWFDLEQYFDEDNYYAIVIGWGPCDNPDFQEDEYYSNGYRVSIKIAANPRDCISQCDFNLDWTQRVVNNNGEIWDTEIWLFPDTNLDKTLDWLFEQWEAMKEFMDNKEKTRQ